MPRHSPFTWLCRQAAELRQPLVADLHVHTTASDGDFTPSQVVAFAAHARLRAIAITDHDTLAGYEEARLTAEAFADRTIEVIRAVEVSTSHNQRSYHVLGYYVNPDHDSLRKALEAIRERRRVRFQAMLEGLLAKGITFPPGAVEAILATTSSLGRRHLASLLMRTGVVRNRHSAFVHHLHSMRALSVPTHSMPLDEACAAIRAAGGVAVLAHPDQEIDESTLQQLRDRGLQGVEAAFPSASVSRTQELRRLAERLNLIVTGGSDSHGGDVVGRAIGAKGVTGAELAALRDLAT